MLCDFFVVRVVRQRSYYKQKKYQVVHEPDKEDEVKDKDYKFLSYFANLIQYIKSWVG